MNNEKIYIKSRKVISEYQEGYIGKKVIEITLNDGIKRKIEQITKNKRDGNAVVIIPELNNNEFIIIEELRPNISDELVLEFPAGMIDEGEDSITAAKRELLEETGYNSDNLELLEWHYQDQGCSKAIITTFIAHDCYKVQEQNLDESEIIKVKTLKYNEILEDIKNNKDFNDANSKIAFLSYLLNSK